jgi:outer membrane receptor protein involved in Fe transport
MNLKKKPVAAAVAAILAIRPAADVIADDAATQLEEIVVTSTRRSTSVQDTPISITAVSGETAQQLGMQTLDQMATLVPGLNLINSGPWGNSTIIMRGLNANSINGTGNDTTGGGTVGVYLGETPLYADFKLLDINRVESLMGPQGTLYGAGTLAGAVRYVPNRPDLTNFTADVGGRAYELKEGSGAGHEEQATLNVPLITGMLGIRGTFANYHDPGFIDYPDIVRIPGFGNPQPDFNNPVVRDANLVRENDLNYEKTFSTRISTLFTPFEFAEALLTYAHQDTNTGGRQLQSTDAIGTGPYEAGFRYAEPSERRSDLIGVELTAKLGFADVVASSSYTKQNINTVRDQTDLLLYLSDTGGYMYEDFPQFIAYTTGATSRKQHTNEIRVVSNDQGRFTWIVGYFKNTLTSDSLGIEYTPGLPDFFGIDRPDQMEYYSDTLLSQTEKAAYGELGFKITSAWQVTVGGRHYKYDVDQTNLTDLPLLNKGPYEFSPKVRTGTTGDSGSLFKFNTSYKITSDIMAYATVSQGYRLGGFNAVAPCPEGVLTGQNVCALPSERQFLPDKTLNKEIGLRTQWLDHRLTVNADVYYIDWKDVQVNGITQNGAVGITTNGAKAVSKGVELSMQGALPYGFGVTANYTYTNAKLTQAVKGLVDDRYTLERDPENPNYIKACDPGDKGYSSTPVGACPGDALAGDRLPGSPEHKGAVYASWSHGLPNDAVFRADYGVALQSNVFTKVGDRASGEALGGYATHQMALSVEKDNWMVGLYGENIWNKYAATAVTNDKSFNYTVLGGTAADPTAFAVRRYARTLIRPREIGLQFRMKFDGK